MNKNCYTQTILLLQFTIFVQNKESKGTSIKLELICRLSRTLQVKIQFIPAGNSVFIQHSFMIVLIFLFRTKPQRYFVISSGEFCFICCEYPIKSQQRNTNVFVKKVYFAYGSRDPNLWHFLPYPH